MSAKVTLTVQGGRYDGHELVFDDHTQCVLGRARDCGFSISDSEDNLVTSRHHCQITIGLPEIRIRDLASRNGTFVNGKNIGQRPQGLSLAAAAAEVEPAYPLNDGDEVRIGHLVFQVGIETDSEH